MLVTRPAPLALIHHALEHLEIHCNLQGCSSLKVKQVLKYLGGSETYRRYVSSCLRANAILAFFSKILSLPSFSSQFHHSLSGFFQAKWFFWHGESAARSKNHNLKWSINREGEYLFGLPWSIASKQTSELLENQLDCYIFTYLLYFF